MYLSWNQTTITDFSEKNITSLYSQGYVFTRRGKGILNETRSLRIDLTQFKLSSENRRVLRKTEDIQLGIATLPYTKYDWQIGKLAKDFYDTKFGEGTFSANKIKELLVDTKKSNFNTLFRFVIARSEATKQSPSLNTAENNGITASVAPLPPRNDSAIGYCIAYQNADILHYCYPFYQLSINKEQRTVANLGIGMMTKAITWAKERNKKYVYLGSFSRPTDTYKLQFDGLEWWDGKVWGNNLEELKNSLK